MCFTSLASALRMTSLGAGGEWGCSYPRCADKERNCSSESGSEFPRVSRERLADGFASAPGTDTLDRGAALIPAPSVASKDTPGTPLGLGGWKDTAAGTDLGSRPSPTSTRLQSVHLSVWALLFN